MKKLNPKYMPYYIAFVQAMMIAYAGIHYFDGLWGWFIGAGVGAGVSLSLAIASSRISDIAKKRQPLARTMYYGLYILSPTVIVLTLFFPQSVITVIAWAAAPDFAIGLTGSIIGKSLVADSQQPATRQVQAATQKKQKKSKMARPAACPYCKREGTLGAINAHKGSCHKNPANQFAEMAKAER